MPAPTKRKQASSASRSLERHINTVTPTVQNNTSPTAAPSRTGTNSAVTPATRHKPVRSSKKSRTSGSRSDGSSRNQNANTASAVKLDPDERGRQLSTLERSRINFDEGVLCFIPNPVSVPIQCCHTSCKPHEESTVAMVVSYDGSLWC